MDSHIGESQSGSAEREHHHDRHEHHVRLTIQTLSGNYHHEFKKNDHLKYVVHETFEHLHIVPAPGEVWELRFNETVLNLEQTIEHAHLPDCATLKLAPKESGGGATRAIAP